MSSFKSQTDRINEREGDISQGAVSETEEVLQRRESNRRKQQRRREKIRQGKQSYAERYSIVEHYRVLKKKADKVV